ncbi:LacI family DNA-binding transcriptional regulator [Frigoribacterium faeni]|uniref:DNA-binding LacI/PurR family transcriptional regulator n=1 Tax=Frigoribacterium faeni TaxID=145483 RepID=A0A7W3PJP4_9MICO|nr:LacI family DNA-binding transcriptional regulator [Frigoribacterium faeni]MBA8813974.1 DNA-binding LacI/PurR family transcriptional regulator [Frigoribacterium faeni]BFF15314.1 LacI family DNA-binding transcriptional regulator [Microbacterium flavescens]GEK84241.1 LacI family transcriptional regulator [Frigoribacterium faeni]
MAERVTIVEVAARAGVAISSVSSALNDRPGVSEQTRARIKQAADDLGFVPSVRGRSLSAKRAFAVGLVVHRDPFVLESDPFFGSFIGGLESVLDPRGYALILQMGSAADETLDRYRRLAAGRRVDGVFLNELVVDDPRVPLVQQLGLPAVGVNPAAGFPLPAVRQDDSAGIRELVDHLVALGHRRFAHVSGPDRFVHARRRSAAWRDALVAADRDPGVVVEADFTYDGGARAAAQLLGGGGAGGSARVGDGSVRVDDPSERPTAVFCANDLAAIGFMAEADRLGVRVPDDVSVAGFDGIELGTYVRPALTTLTTAPRLIGAEAARLLLAAVDGDPVPDAEIDHARLLVRASTAPAPR